MAWLNRDNRFAETESRGEAMPKQIVCLSEQLRQFAEIYRSCFSKRQWKYFVIVLLGLIECEEMAVTMPKTGALITRILLARQKVFSKNIHKSRASASIRINAGDSSATNF